MQTWIVWTERPVTDLMLRHFAEVNGGYWNDVIGDEAVIERGDARVFIATASADDEDNVMPEDVARATSRMGATPASMLSITIGHASGSNQVAEEIVARAIKEWGGFLDRNEAKVEVQ